jgi:hypothetical protein
MGSEELYGVGASTPRRSDQVKVENLKLLQHHANSWSSSWISAIFAPSLQFTMDDLYDEYVLSFVYLHFF